VAREQIGVEHPLVLREMVNEHVTFQNAIQGRHLSSDGRVMGHARYSARYDKTAGTALERGMALAGPAATYSADVDRTSRP
jgi:hypothetical protein